MQSLIVSPHIVHLEQIHCPPLILGKQSLNELTNKKTNDHSTKKSMTSFEQQGAILLMFTSLAGGFSSI
jgi:hypothetical protein